MIFRVGGLKRPAFVEIHVSHGRGTGPDHVVIHHASLRGHAIGLNLRFRAQPPPLGTALAPGHLVRTRASTNGLVLLDPHVGTGFPPSHERLVGTTAHLVRLLVTGQRKGPSAAGGGGRPLPPAHGVVLRLQRNPQFLPVLGVHDGDDAQRPRGQARVFQEIVQQLREIEALADDHPLHGGELVGVLEEELETVVHVLARHEGDLVEELAKRFIVVRVGRLFECEGDGRSFVDLRQGLLRRVGGVDGQHRVRVLDDVRRDIDRRRGLVWPLVNLQRGRVRRLVDLRWGRVRVRSDLQWGDRRSHVRQRVARDRGRGPAAKVGACRPREGDCRGNVPVSHFSRFVARKLKIIYSI